MNAAPPRHILAIKLRNIGDVLLMTPTLQALRTAFPEARITALVNDYTAPMLANNPDIDACLCLERRQLHGNPLRRLAYEISMLRRVRALNADVAIDFTSGDRSARYAWFSGASRRLAHRHRRWSRWNWKHLAYTQLTARPPSETHAVLRDLDLVNALVPEVPVPRHLRLLPGESNLGWAQAQWNALEPGARVHVHPVARWLYKCWHDERMAAVMDWLAERGARVILTSGPEEREIARARRILSLCKYPPTALLGETSLLQLAALSATADVFLGVDTAPMHIAAASETPVVALFGPTGEDWHPWSPYATVLRAPCPDKHLRETISDTESLIDVSVEDVLEALKPHLKL